MCPFMGALGATFGAVEPEAEAAADGGITMSCAMDPPLASRTVSFSARQLPAAMSWYGL